MTITEPGTVIDGKIITGQLRVLADNVVIKNSKISFGGSWGIDGYGAKNLTVQDCDITGPGYSAGSDSAIAGTGNFLRNDISKVQNGITLNDGSSVVQGNYIHDLESAGADPHYDGIQAFGGHVNTKILNNTVLSRDTSSILISDLWGNNNGIEVRGNFFGGNPGAQIYVTGDHYANDRGGTGSGTLNVVIEDNAIAKGVYDYFYIVDANPVIQNNQLLPKGTLPSDISGGTDGGTTNPDDGSIVPDTGTGDGGTAPDTGTGDGGTAPDTGTDTGETVTTITGTDGNDKLPASGVSNAGNEKFYGLAGDDVLEGGAGADYLDGGDGSDTVSYASSNAGVTVNLKAGKGYGGHAEGDTIVSAGLVVGSSYADKLLGNDILNILDGGKGADTLTGYLGDDTYIVDNAGDVVVEASGGGRDTVRSSVSFTLGANVENLVLTGSANISGSGNDLANVVHGNRGANTLKGGAGNDTIYGHGGNDTLTGGLGNDAFVFDTAPSATSNVDRITDFSVVDDVIHLDNAVFTALTADGALSSANFVKNYRGVARDANDHIVYEIDTGKLFYDSNGSARGGSVHIATLDANLNLQASDFVVI